MRSLSAFSVVRCLTENGPMSQIALADVFRDGQFVFVRRFGRIARCLGAVINVNGLWSVTYHATRLSADTLSASLPGVVFLDETTSTNDEAMKRSSPILFFPNTKWRGVVVAIKRWFSLPAAVFCFRRACRCRLGRNR